MLQAFVFEHVAVLVGPWHEPADPPERGARVEVRLLAPEPHRGSPSAAQRVVVDRAVFRADLFDQIDAAPGNLRSAHFHPHFDGVEPCDRTWPDAVKRDPAGWLAVELGDLRGLLERGGCDLRGASWVEGDADGLREALPAVLDAVERAWAAARATPSPYAAASGA